MKGGKGAWPRIAPRRSHPVVVRRRERRGRGQVFRRRERSGVTPTQPEGDLRCVCLRQEVFGAPAAQV